MTPPIVPERGVPLTAETVVVPVEPTEAMISALDASLHDHWPDARKMALGAWKSALAAAPAREPEGGAVDAIRRYLLDRANSSQDEAVRFDEEAVEWAANPDANKAKRASNSRANAESCRADAQKFRAWAAALTPKEAPAATGAGEDAETGWLIESDANGPLYQMAGRTTRNAVEALRFAREVDAEAYIAAHGPNHINSVLTLAWRAVEHRWG